MKKVVLEGRRADVSWGHLSVEGIEHATEVFGQAVWDANDAAVMDPNLIVRITIETALRPVVAGSIWKGRVDGLERVAHIVNRSGISGRLVNGNWEDYPLTDKWYSAMIWVSDP